MKYDGQVVELGVDPSNQVPALFPVILGIITFEPCGVEIEVFGPGQRDAVVPDVFGIFYGVKG
jgi:hypothetical protein